MASQETIREWEQQIEFYRKQIEWHQDNINKDRATLERIEQHLEWLRSGDAAESLAGIDRPQEVEK